jgi:hypothetical protein
LHELKNDTAPYAMDYIVFFKGFKSMEIDIFFSDIEHLIDFEAPMSDKWLDFMLVHAFVYNIISNKDTYLLSNAQASKVLQNEVQNGRGTKRWGTKYFKHSSNLRNSMVVPYLDKDHWSIYIHEEKWCIHCNYIPRFHNDVTS